MRKSLKIFNFRDLLDDCSTRITGRVHLSLFGWLLKVVKRDPQCSWRGPFRRSWHKIPFFKRPEWAVDNAFRRICNIVASINTKTTMHEFLCQKIIQGTTPIGGFKSL